MKRQFVDGLQEGDQVNDYFVAVRKDLRPQHSGGKFLGMVFKDRTGEIGGILWNNAASIAQMFEVGDVVNVRGNITRYQDRLQVRVDQVLPLRKEEYDNDDLVYVPEHISDTANRYRELVGTIQNEWLVKLLREFTGNDELMARFEGAAAGKRWHHAYSGGLIEHCYEMSRIAETVCELFPALDRDLLLTAIFFHDIGKVDEMSQDLCVEYTTEGKLLGHLIIGTQMLRDAARRIEGFPQTLEMQLAHCILAHHGEYANGSAVLPKTMEAVVLYHIDNLSAQANATERLVDEARERQQEWTEYITHMDRQLWTKRG